MIVKTVKKDNGTNYINYICSTHKKYGTCRNNNVSVKAIEKTALLVVQRHVDMLVNTDILFDGMNESELRTRKKDAIDGMIKRNIQSIHDNRDLLVKTIENLSGGVITVDEFHIFKAAFNNKITEAENNIVMLRREQDNLADNKRALENIERFKAYGNIEELNRRIVVTLLKSIIVHSSKDVQIGLRYATDFNGMTAMFFDAPALCGKVGA